MQAVGTKTNKEEVMLQLSGGDLQWISKATIQELEDVAHKILSESGATSFSVSRTNVSESSEIKMLFVDEVVGP